MVKTAVWDDHHAFLFLLLLSVAVPFDHDRFAHFSDCLHLRQLPWVPEHRARLLLQTRARNDFGGTGL
jgi:hypothetical protein